MKKPTLEDVLMYCFDRDNGISAEAFIDYYDSVGWMIGKKPMKDWKASVRTWERNQKQNTVVVKGVQQSFMDRITDQSWAD